MVGLDEGNYQWLSSIILYLVRVQDKWLVVCLLHLVVNACSCGRRKEQLVGRAMMNGDCMSSKSHLSLLL